MRKILLEDFNSIDNIYYANYYFNEPDNRSMHIHDHYEIYFLLEGEMKYKFYNNDILLSKNNIQFIFPENEHEYEFTNKLKNCRIINISFTLDLLDESTHILLNSTNKNRKYGITKFSSEIIRDIAKKCIILNNTMDRSIRKSVLNNILSSYFIEYNELIKTENINIPIWLLDATKEMEEYDNFRVGLRRFVDFSGKSQEYLSREMKRHFNVTPTEYINNLRLDYATKLIAQSNTKILSIIFDVGFNNVSHFENLFKKKYGMSPRQFRNNNKNIF